MTYHNVVSLRMLLRLFGIISLMRPKQWIKNGFVLAPLLFYGEFLNPNAVSHAQRIAIIIMWIGICAWILWPVQG